MYVLNLGVKGLKAGLHVLRKHKHKYKHKHKPRVNRDDASNIHIFEYFRKSERTPEVPIFECKLCTKVQHHRILQESPIRVRLLTKPSLSFVYM